MIFLVTSEENISDNEEEPTRVVLLLDTLKSFNLIEYSQLRLNFSLGPSFKSFYSIYEWDSQSRDNYFGSS